MNYIPECPHGFQIGECPACLLERATDPVTPVAGLIQGCAICGGRMTEARGRHPGDAPRMVCPTCLADKMDMIRELAGQDYGLACSAPPNEQIKKITTGLSSETPD